MQRAVTYTFVVEVDDEDDVTQAVEEYVASVDDPFGSPDNMEDPDAPEPAWASSCTSGG